MTNESKTHLLKIAITVVASLVAVAHLLWPGLNVDAITVTLLVIALVPWFSAIFKTLEFPGGWKVEFREIKEQLQSIIAKDTEPLEPSVGGLSGKGFAVNSESTRLVIRALGNPKYTWRYLGGLKAETGRPEEEVLSAIKWLLANKLVTESSNRDERLWALSEDGRQLLRSL